MPPRLILLAALLAATALHASIPDAIPYQGRITANGVNFTGTGQFKFAIYQHATGNYTPAATTAVVNSGFITSVTIVSGGSGYSAAGVTVSFTGGGGNGATATASVANGAISGVTVTGTGSGYTSTPSVVFTDPAAPAQLWNNAAGATTGALAEQAVAVALPVNNGSYNAGLGDTSIPSMAALPASLVPAAGQRAFVRVWFNDGTHGFQALSPDTELRSVPFAREAAAVAGIASVTLARTDTANTFTNVDGLTVTGTGPQNNYFPPRPASGASIPVTGAGTRMEFLPGYSAFRAGSVNGSQWDAANIGAYSTALGYNTTASGPYSTALGSGSTASNVGATAMGLNTIASANSSTASGYVSIASGYGSTALGDHAQATGEGSTALGKYTTAGGLYSTASGNYSQATGYGTTALGVWTAARGSFSTALGLSTSAESFGETVLGCYDTNYTPAGTDTWSAADRLFVVGNGTSDTVRSDALTLYKNAVLTVKGNGPSVSAPAADATVPVVGAGTLMMFLPGYSAFRAGSVTASQWNAANIGLYSAAMGLNTNASGYAATAMGYDSTAYGVESTAMGCSTTAFGNFSTAMGADTSANGSFATAMGFATYAASWCETTIGCFNTAAVGPSASNWVGSDRLFVIGNGTSLSAHSDALIVFKNGNATLQGDLIAKSFVTTSDRNSKADIIPADTAALLAGVAALPIATWKFKEETVTHLGPMAQDFAAAFHLGSTDTGIATVDADGVALASIQELKKQLDAKDARIATLEREQTATNARLAAIEAKLAK